MNAFERVFYTGVGLALKGKGKAEELAKKIAKESKMEAKEGKIFVGKAVKQAEATKKELADKIDESVKIAINKMGLLTKKEADSLKAEVKKLKAELEKAKGKKSKKK